MRQDLPETAELLKDARSWGMTTKFIYIAEAHAINEWPIGDHLSNVVPPLTQHRTLQERVKVALRFQREFREYLRAEDVFVDNPETCEVENTLHPWPTAWFIINRKGELVYRTITRHAFFPPVSEVRKALFQVLQCERKKGVETNTKDDAVSKI